MNLFFSFTLFRFCASLFSFPFTCRTQTQGMQRNWRYSRIPESKWTASSSAQIRREAILRIATGEVSETESLHASGKVDLERQDRSSLTLLAEYTAVLRFYTSLPALSHEMSAKQYQRFSPVEIWRVIFRLPACTSERAVVRLCKSNAWSEWKAYKLNWDVKENLATKEVGYWFFQNELLNVTIKLNWNYIFDKIEAY